MTEECIFCWKNSCHTFSEISQQSSQCYAARDNHPVTKGHTLIIPKVHIEHWFLAPKDIQSELMDLLLFQKKELDDLYSPDGYNVGFNCSIYAGQSIPHLHVHLIPRYKGDSLHPEGGVRGVIADKQKYR